MFEKMFNKIKINRDNAVKTVIAIIIASVFLLSMSILTEDKNAGKGVVSSKESKEEALCSFLSDIEGVGAVNVMIEYGEKKTGEESGFMGTKNSSENKVTGVIVTAEGAEDPVVKTNIVKGVSTLFDVPVSSVMVFQKSGGDIE